MSPQTPTPQTKVRFYSGTVNQPGRQRFLRAINAEPPRLEEAQQALDEHGAEFDQFQRANCEGLLAQASGNLAQAERIFSGALRVAEGAMQLGTAYSNLSAALLLQRKLKEARDFAAKGTEACPNSPTCWVNLLYSLEQLEETEAVGRALQALPGYFRLDVGCPMRTYLLHDKDLAGVRQHPAFDRLDLEGR